MMQLSFKPTQKQMNPIARKSTFWFSMQTAGCRVAGQEHVIRENIRKREKMLKCLHPHPHPPLCFQFHQTHVLFEIIYLMTDGHHCGGGNYRPLAHRGNATNLGGKTNEIFSSGNWDLIVLPPRLAAFSPTCKGSIPRLLSLSHDVFIISYVCCVE